MSNLLKTLEKLGFKPDFPGDHLALYFDNGENGEKKVSAVVRISDSDIKNQGLPTEETKGFYITIDTYDNDGVGLEDFMISDIKTN